MLFFRLQKENSKCLFRWIELGMIELNLVGGKWRKFSTNPKRLGQTCDCPRGRAKESELEQSSHGLVHADQVCGCTRLSDIMLVLGRAHRLILKSVSCSNSLLRDPEGFSMLLHTTRLLEIPMRILYYEHVQFVAPPVQWGPAPVPFSLIGKNNRCSSHRCKHPFLF